MTGRHDSFTLGWTPTAASGVPVGAQVALPPWMASGCPIEVTRTLPVVHVALAHGPPETGGNGQPDTVHGVGSAIAAAPAMRTRALDIEGCAVPPCAQRTFAPCWIE
ncbi:hypothetical protein ACKI1J_24750 [Streptomyces scabiei]|uniref:hypothetical protein n=1 Tax=Streptomyces scabiei TaxID=1930 RepID=UPI0038F71703